MSVYHLPTELLLEITTHLSIADARSFIQLSKYFNHILENELYLKALSYDDEEGLPLRSHVVAAYRWKLTALKRFIRLRPGINYTKVKTRPSKYADLLPELGSEEAATLFGSRGYLYPEEYGSATLLHIVSSLGQAEIIPLILEGRGDVTVTDSRSRTALHCAVWGGDVSTVQLLLDSGADVSVPAGLEPSPLLCAANSYLTNGDDPKIVKVLLDAGADALARTTDGATALHLTHSAGVAKLLLDACPDLLHCLCNNQIAPLDNIHNPLYPEDISVFLVESGGLIESPVAFHQSLLHSAAEKGHDRLVEALIKRDKTLLQKVTHRGETALHSAADDTRAGPKCARILIDAGIDIFAATTKYKETALHYAAKFYAGAEFFQALIQAGIDVEQRDGNGNTALHILFKSFAASNDIAPLLIAKSSIETLSSLNKEGESPLHYTARNCSDNTVRLLAAGVDPYLVNERGQTLLHRTRNIDTLTQLLEDINVNRGQVSKGKGMPPCAHSSSPLACY